MKDQIYTYGTSPYYKYAAVSPDKNLGTPGTHSILMEAGETPEQAVARCAKEYRDKAERLLRWADRLDAALGKEVTP